MRKIVLLVIFYPLKALRLAGVRQRGAAALQEVRELERKTHLVNLRLT